MMLKIFMRDPTNILLISAQHAHSVPYFITQITTPITYEMQVLTPSSAVRLMRMLNTDMIVPDTAKKKNNSQSANFQITPA